jgi:hypothetical protein
MSARAKFPPTAKQICSGEDYGGWPSQGLSPGRKRVLLKLASGSRQPVPAYPRETPSEIQAGRVRMYTQGPQAQHRARTSEYPNQAPESTKTPVKGQGSLNEVFLRRRNLAPYRLLHGLKACTPRVGGRTLQICPFPCQNFGSMILVLVLLWFLPLKTQGNRRVSRERVWAF